MMGKSFDQVRQRSRVHWNRARRHGLRAKLRQRAGAGFYTLCLSYRFRL